MSADISFDECALAQRKIFCILQMLAVPKPSASSVQSVSMEASIPVLVLLLFVGCLCRTPGAFLGTAYLIELAQSFSLLNFLWKLGIFRKY